MSSYVVFPCLNMVSSSKLRRLCQFSVGSIELLHTWISEHETRCILYLIEFIENIKKNYGHNRSITIVTEISIGS